MIVKDKYGKIIYTDEPLGSEMVKVSELPVATYNDLQDYMNFFGQRTLITGGVISDSGSGECDIAECTGWCKVSDSDTAIGRFFNFAGKVNQTLTDQQANFIYLDYNGGSPQVVVATALLTHSLKLNHILFGVVFRDDTTLHIHNADKVGISGIGRSNLHWTEHFAVHRVAGAVTSDAGGSARKLAVTAGVVYAGLSRNATNAFNTISPDTFTSWYSTDGGTNWAKESSTAIAIDNLRYNDMDDPYGLKNLTVNKYGVYWIYLDNDGTHLHMVYGQDDYTANGAEEASVPAALPPLVTNYCVLIAKIICQQNQSTLTITLPWVVPFTSSFATDHNLLGSLQGGAVGEYYHLTSARYTLLATDLTATAAELNLLDLAGRTTGDLLMATGAASAAWTAQSGIDHGTIGGLTDDDHTQYILHSLAAAENDFLVASAANTFAKQTLAETLATLSPLTIRGDMMFRNATVSTRLAKGAENTVLVMGANEPAWSATLAGLTLTSPTINGTIATAGLVLPAWQASGAIDVNSQTLNNVTIIDSPATTIGQLKLRGNRTTAGGNSIEFYTPNAAGTDTIRWMVSGTVDQASMRYENCDVNFRPDGTNARLLIADTSVTLGTNLFVAGNYASLTEMAAPGSGAANTARIYAHLVDGGKTELCVIFQSGAVQVIATEP